MRQPSGRTGLTAALLLASLTAASAAVPAAVQSRRAGGTEMAKAATATRREQTKQLVDQAVALVERKGLAGACAVFSEKNGKFWHGATYTYVIDLQKRWVCYPVKPALVGRSPAGIIDDTGGDLVTDQVKLARSPAGEGWLGYSWPNPATGNIQSKESFVKRVPGTDYMVIAGYYK